MLTYFRLWARVRKNMMISKAKMNKRSKDFRNYESLMIIGRSSRNLTLQMSVSLKPLRCKCKPSKIQKMDRKTTRLNLQN